jgi:hypothetical protein
MVEARALVREEATKVSLIGDSTKFIKIKRSTIVQGVLWIRGDQT